MEFSSEGLAMCSRFAFPPNRLHYCGPDLQSDLAEYIGTGKTDQGLLEILQKFETLYPYLILIASANNIRDPFDPHVVNAYWIGNRLLDNVKASCFFRHLEGKLALKQKLSKKRQYMIGELAGGLPHHTFHVLNIILGSGRNAAVHTLETMDNCRIRAGKVVRKNSRKNVYFVRLSRLKYKNRLSLERNTEISVSALNGYEPGDTVAVHWGCIVSRLTYSEALNLEKYTNKAIQYANRIHPLELL